MSQDERRERLADVSHDIWAHWMRYMFKQGSFDFGGGWHMPRYMVDRWYRQMDTRYADLTEREKESDREQADKIIAALNGETT
jgi:hypothetical protein